MSAIWLESCDDPVRTRFLEQGTQPDLDAVLALFPRPQGEPAYDPVVVAGNVERLQTQPAVDTGHPLLDLSVKTGLAHIDATFQGDHPKYGIACYGRNVHDGFPPVIIASVDALSAWGLNERAAQLLRYWVGRFVRADGTIRYRGTSLSELGQLLHKADLLDQRAGPDGWLDACLPGLKRIVTRLVALHEQAQAEDGLLAGSPEDDEREKVAKYFHNNAWVAKGFRSWTELCRRHSAMTATEAAALLSRAERLERDTLNALERTWPEDLEDWWLSPQVEPVPRPARLTALPLDDAEWRLASYTNYRYWPELLSSGILSDKQANRVVDARLSAAGQFCGMTRFAHWLDDWPLAEYLTGLWMLGRVDDFRLSLYGHVAYHQGEGHLTAYEQVTFPPGTMQAAYCLPCQLVAARAARLMLAGG